MDDLISKDRLMEALGISDDCVDCQHRLNGLCLWKPNMVDVCEVIAEMPSADAVEVIRCRECKWYDIKHPYGTVIPDAYHCKINDRFYGETHFCAYGKRRD